MNEIIVEGYNHGKDAQTGAVIWFRDLRGGETITVADQYGWRDGCRDRNVRTVTVAAPARNTVEGCPEWTGKWRIPVTQIGE